MFDILIHNGTIIDGSGNKPFKGNVGIIGDVLSILNADEIAEAKRTIDATGKIVTPGFIDTHSHSSMLINVDSFLAPKLFQGITTEVVAQDGMGPAPVDDGHIEVWKMAMAGLEGKYDFEWNWRSVRDYLKHINKLDLGPNIAYLAPHGNIRMVSMGLDNRTPTADEMARMKVELQKALDEGAFGMSTGMIYPPCLYAETDEFIELGKVLADNDAIFVTHQRNEADCILDSMDEILRIGKESGCRVHFSHFKVCGKNNWDKLPIMLKKLDEAKKEGILVSFDQYPYVAGATMMSAILPPWAHDGGTNKLLDRLRDSRPREKMKIDIQEGIDGWENIIEGAGLDGIKITFVNSEKNEKYVGLSLVELGEATGKEAFDAIFDLICDEENIIGMIIFDVSEKNVRKLMCRVEQNVCTDGIVGGKPHPRLYGSFTRVLGKYSREEKLFPIEIAINKMTGKPAKVLRLNNRGLLKEGYAADVLVIDPEKVMDMGDYEKPKQLSVGMDFVIVNGKVLIEKGRETPQKAGVVLKSRSRL